jgi:hypothetical protein
MATLISSYADPEHVMQSVLETPLQVEQSMSHTILFLYESKFYYHIGCEWQGKKSRIYEL